jgi:hypothetical protein
MKIILMLLALISFTGLITYSVKKDAGNPELQQPEVNTESKSTALQTSQPVLVELFTSEGCSSCPPADRNLIFLEKQPQGNAEIIALSFHVDYWNRLGWSDPFSSAKYSERQGFYSYAFNLGDRVYTPQMVVDGSYQFVGGNLGEAQKAIAETAQAPKANVELAVSEGRLKVKISKFPEHSFANVFLAIAENELSTAVKRGENGGKILAHTAVVRELRAIGSVKAEDKDFETETIFQTPAAWNRKNLKLVVFIQEEEKSKIIGVNQIKL